VRHGAVSVCHKHPGLQHVGAGSGAEPEQRLAPLTAMCPDTLDAMHGPFWRCQARNKSGVDAGPCNGIAAACRAAGSGAAGRGGARLYSSGSRQGFPLSALRCATSTAAGPSSAAAATAPAAPGSAQYPYDRLLPEAAPAAPPAAAGAAAPSGAAGFSGAQVRPSLQSCWRVPRRKGCPGTGGGEQIAPSVPSPAWTAARCGQGGTGRSSCCNLLSNSVNVCCSTPYRAELACTPCRAHSTCTWMMCTGLASKFNRMTPGSNRG